jgi:hypothetical protein
MLDMGASWLATLLDEEMLQAGKGVQIADRFVEDDRLLQKTGQAVWDELGGRYFLRYVLGYQVGEFASGSSRRHCVTPTPIAIEDTISYLNLPRPVDQRLNVMILDPRRIDLVSGPRWVRGGKGIEYVLPRGFPPQARVFEWEQQVT